MLQLVIRKLEKFWLLMFNSLTHTASPVLHLRTPKSWDFFPDRNNSNCTILHAVCFCVWSNECRLARATLFTCLCAMRWKYIWILADKFSKLGYVCRYRRNVPSMWWVLDVPFHIFHANFLTCSSKSATCVFCKLIVLADYRLYWGHPVVIQKPEIWRICEARIPLLMHFTWITPPLGRGHPVFIQKRAI